MLIKLTEVYKNPGDRVHIGELFLAKETVTSIREEQGGIINEAMALGISEHAGFSRITYSEGGVARTAIVIGNPHEIRAKLGVKNILKG